MRQGAACSYVLPNVDERSSWKVIREAYSPDGRMRVCAHRHTLCSASVLESHNFDSARMMAPSAVLGPAMCHVPCAQVHPCGRALQQVMAGGQHSPFVVVGDSAEKPKCGSQGKESRGQAYRDVSSLAQLQRGSEEMLLLLSFSRTTDVMKTCEPSILVSRVTLL